jgi:O-antigen ligase
MFWTHLLAESGVFGTAAFLGIIATCFVLGRRAYREAVSPQRKALLLGLLYVIPTGVLVSLFSSELEESGAASLFWALMGMLTVLAVPFAPERFGATREQKEESLADLPRL